MNADTPSIDAPNAAPILLKKLGGAIVAAIDSTAFAVITLACSFITYLALLGFGNGAHGKWPDGTAIFVVWLVLLVSWSGSLAERYYSNRSSFGYTRFENERLHSAALWYTRLKTSRKLHLACWPLLLALFWSSTAMQYSAPGGDGMTANYGEYVVRVDGVTLSSETPTVRALPWRCEWVPLRWNKYSAETRTVSSDGIKFDVTIVADLALGSNPNMWLWKSSPNLSKYPKIDEALAKAAQSAISKVRAREIDRGTFALEIDAAAALNLAQAGVRPDGEISISLKPYFDGSEAIPASFKPHFNGGEAKK